jgi:hypothetical protein
LSLFADLTLSFSGLSAAIALATAIQAVVEYRLQGRQGRADHFLRLRERLKNDKRLGQLSELIDLSFAPGAEGEDARRQVRKISLSNKRDYLGLFEEVAISQNSGLIKDAVARYMFGYYAVRCLQCRPFWDNINPVSRGWDAFFAFARDAESWEARQRDLDAPYNPREIRF